MSLKRPTIVLFDMDGTTVRHVNPWLLHVLEWLDDLYYNSARLSSRLLRREIRSQPLVGRAQQGKRQKLLVHRAIHRFRRKPVEQIVEPCPGIYGVLDFLAESGIPMGLASNGLGKGYGHDILQTFGLEKYFEVTMFREDFTRSKPHPDPILQALDAMKKKPASGDVIWYIGDRHKDIAAAIAASEHLPCEIQPLAYGLNAAVAALEKGLGPDHIVMGWPDLEKKLRALPGKKRHPHKSPAPHENEAVAS